MFAVANRFLLAGLLYAVALPTFTLAAEPTTAKGEVAAVVAPAAAAININEASASDLARMLKGVGPSRARAIVDYRTTHGRFEDIESLAAVRGVSPAIVERNRAVIRLED